MAGAVALALLVAPLAARGAAPPAPPAGSQGAPRAAPATTQPIPAEIEQLLGLLSDPAVRSWLAQHRAATTTAAPTAASEEETVSSYFSHRVASIRAHLRELAKALPRLPGEFAVAGATLIAEMRDRGLAWSLLLFGGMFGLAVGAEQLLRRMTAAAKRRLRNPPLETIGDRLHAAGTPLALDLAYLSAFTLGAVTTVLAFDWPPLLREAALGYFLAVLAVRIAGLLCRLFLGPAEDRFVIAAMPAPAARFWQRRILLFVGWFSFGWATVELTRRLGVSLEVSRIVAYTLGIGLLGMGMEMVWRRPRADAGGGDGAPRFAGRVTAFALSAYLLALWLLWVVRAMPVFWLAVFLLALPAALRLTRRTIDAILRPPTAAGEHVPSVAAVFVERAVRAAVALGAVLLLARTLEVDFVDLAAGESLLSRIVVAGLSVAVIVLLADLCWHVVKAIIDRKIAEAQAPAAPGTDAERRHMRLRTLLPIVRRVIFVLIVTLTGLMVLSHLGVQIGPLIASAGVIGIAVGFGSQTLVRDVISGTLYLLDDAFRVGEYIESGNYKGTVESIGFRSVKLRHQRGPLATVPFGVLGAVKNMSRDWAIDKITVGVTYDTDLAKVKSLVKQIGKELEADPEFAPHILDTLKMQGVGQFGDFAIQIQLKMMTRPGEQFMIRRRANALIKKAFDENGIKFAFPTVQVAGGAEQPVAAAAQKALELVRPAVQQ